MIKFISNERKDMANGMRDTSMTPLTQDEIKYVLSQVKRIEADESVFVFNDPVHITKSTCYSYTEDKIYVTRNVFPDDKYGSTHPRDVMSVAAVLAHEYYGHRTFKEEYLSDIQYGPEYNTTPLWKDECRASITAAKIAPNLTEREKSDLVLDAIYRAKEFGHLIEMDDFMLFMGTQVEKKTSHNISPQSLLLAKQARMEMMENGYITIICPKCQEHPKITTTSNGERTIVTCRCGYIINVDINL